MGKCLKTARMDPDKGMDGQGHALLTWPLRKGLNMEHSGHQTWDCAALICMNNSSISQHLGQEMRLSLSSNEHKPHSYSRGLSGFSICSSPLPCLSLLGLNWVEMYFPLFKFDHITFHDRDRSSNVDDNDSMEMTTVILTLHLD